MGIRSITVLALVLLSFLSAPLSAQRDTKICLYYFYGMGCSACARVEPYIGQLEQKCAQLEVHRFEIYGNRTNLLHLNRYFDKYEVPQDQRIIPAVFISNSYLTGDKQISEHLEERVVPLLETGCPCSSLEGEVKELTALSLLVVTLENTQSWDF